MKKIIVAGIGTGVGKTVVSAILMQMCEGAYWKPVECGDSDTNKILKLLPYAKERIHPSAYTFKAFAAPHLAADKEKQRIDPKKIIPPQQSPLIIESVGGALVPLNLATMTIDLFKKWGALWVVVSRHYLGSINHTLLTTEILKQHGLNVKGIIFNGAYQRDVEEAILRFSKLPLLGRLLPEKMIDGPTIERYALQWKQQLQQILL